MYVGSIRYDLHNSDYDEKTKGGWCYKSAELPGSVVDAMRAGIRAGRDISFEIPLDVGSNYIYRLTPKEMSEVLEAGDAFIAERN